MSRSKNARLGIAGFTSVLTFALAAGCASSGPSAPAAPNTVRTTLLSFMPTRLTVKAGTTVTWMATDGISHTVTTGTFVLGSDGLRTSEHPDGLIGMPLTQGHNVTFKFTKPGTYTYYCSIHKGMTGEIVVTP